MSDLADSLLDSLIDLTTAVNDMPSEVYFELAQLEQPFAQKNQQLRNRTFTIAAKFLSYLDKNIIIEDMDDLENACEASMTRILNELDLADFSNKNKMKVIPVAKTEFKDINGISFLYSNTVSKPPKFSPKINPPEKLNAIKSIPNFATFKSNSIDFNKYKTIDNERDLLSLSQQLLKTNILFLSLEIHRIRTYRPYPCLLTLYSPTYGLFIIDLMKLRFNLDPLKEILQNPDLVKVFFDPNIYDLLVESCGIFISPSIDLSLSYPGKTIDQCIKELNEEQESLQNIVVDWRIRPLTKFMESTAIEGVLHLPHLAAMAENIVLPEQIIPSFIPYSFTPEMAEKMYNDIIAKYGDLEQFSSTILKELISWRDSVAAIEDESPNFFVTDNQIWKIAKNLPTTQDELISCFGTVIPPLVSTYRGDILQMIVAAKEKSEGKTPLYLVK